MAGRIKHKKKVEGVRKEENRSRDSPRGMGDICKNIGTESSPHGGKKRKETGRRS
jgi:hypothetical protein